MVQFDILSGDKAGTVWKARRFPVRIGRAASADLQLAEPGVWDRHLRLELRPNEGFVLAREDEALASVNDEPICETTLHNGDIIGLGSSRIQFWLGENQQGGLRVREALTWCGIGLVSLTQMGLIYWLLR